MPTACINYIGSLRLGEHASDLLGEILHSLNKITQSILQHECSHPTFAKHMRQVGTFRFHGKHEKGAPRSDQHSGAGRIVRIELSTGKVEDVITGFKQDVYGKGPMYDIGPLGLAFLDANTLVVGGGDLPRVERIPQGLLGARISRDASGYYRIERILPGHNWDPKYRSPLTEIGVNVQAGDFILAVNGRSTREMTDLYAALVGTAGKQIRLRINRRPAEEDAREVTIIPTDNEQPLYYLDWVLKNIETVEQATDGRVGYVHVPDMGVPGLNEFAKFFYPQLHKEALIVDVRGNGGGNVSPMIAERLRREPVFWTIARNGAVNVDPAAQVLGPKVLLLDQHSASDGDIIERSPLTD